MVRKQIDRMVTSADEAAKVLSEIKKVDGVIPAYYSLSDLIHETWDDESTTIAGDKSIENVIDELKQRDVQFLSLLFDFHGATICASADLRTLPSDHITLTCDNAYKKVLSEFAEEFARI